MRPSLDAIASARVQRAFRHGTRYLMAGTILSQDELRSIPIANRNALVDSRFLHLSFKSETVAAAGGERHVIPLGFGRYDVVEGRKVNDEGPLTREEAHALAGVQLPRKHPQAKRKAAA